VIKQWLTAVVGTEAAVGLEVRRTVSAAVAGGGWVAAGRVESGEGHQGGRLAHGSQRKTPPQRGAEKTISRFDPTSWFPIRFPVTSIRVTELERRAFFTPKTLGAYLAISERTVRSMLAAGTIPSYRFEGARRIDPDDVDRSLAQRREPRQ
jgi:excisionase family DNA binding protein